MVIEGTADIDRSPRIFKRHRNRRLYDPSAGRYLTRNTVRTHVVGGVDFVVLDQATEADLTREVLLDLVGMLEQQETPLLSPEFLLQLIRCYGTRRGRLLASYLQQSLNLFLGQLTARGPARRRSHEQQLRMVLRLAQQNFQSWRKVQAKISRKLERA